ncbi:SUKH-4 family immunity protein [Streptomyces sp. ISL-22]|uniref:SUKH-4 family immunity protein n=1 Tax=unclassified Streptomyces TaxID=2593676 RepID=UPI001BEBF3A0|nr:MULTISPECIES: SUKH-4 family immunity protein [unclassified Streptomyces]MBT2421940.1 SUKH-4 family immunity protein [Streptomyces sp. ISL-24]MBT2436375.1 SUKH-4 family immunity protein [Streptomyces sp. ISL-22]
MTSHLDLVQTFGEENVTSVNYEQLRAIGLQSQVARVLSEVGLPRQLSPVFTTQVVGEPANFSVHEFDASGQDAKILVIGGSPGDKDVRYFLDVYEGLVGMFALTEGNMQMETINSTIHDFVAFLHQCGVYLKKIDEAAEEERLELVEELRSRLAEQDPPALEVPDSWWSIVVDHLKGRESRS